MDTAKVDPRLRGDDEGLLGTRSGGEGSFFSQGLGNTAESQHGAEYVV